MSTRIGRALALALVWLGSLAPLAATAAERPNILLIYADDQSYKTLSCYGGGPEWVSTPNIDRLASTSVRFERSYNGAWCMPSRASVLTGRLQHGVMSMTMAGQYPGSKYDPEQCPFIPAQMRAQGYHTAQIGKWHTGTDAGYGRDWDYQIVWNRPLHPENAGNYFYDQILSINGVERTDPGYSTDNYTQWAVDYIGGEHRDAEKPWYLWLCYGAIHGPTTPAQRHLGTLEGRSATPPTDIVGPWPQKPAYLANTAAWVLGPDGRPQMASKARAATSFDTLVPGKSYDAWIQQVNECMAAVDEGVGRLLSALDESGQLDNTIVIYTADQGYGLGEHGFNQKVAAYDATVASPLIVRWPGHTPAGKVCKHAVNATDLVDFVCRAAEVEVPWTTHGRDIRPLLTDPETTDWDAPMIMTHTARNYGAETHVIPTDDSLTSTSGVPWYVLLRHGQYKYIRTFVEGEMEEIYDLESDPEELTNLALEPANAGLLRDLRQEALSELRRTEAGFVDDLPRTQAEVAGG